MQEHPLLARYTWWEQWDPSTLMYLRHNLGNGIESLKSLEQTISNLVSGRLDSVDRMADEYVRMTMPELKEMANERGLHVKKGLKKTNGLVERFNGTLKEMLKAYVDSNPNDWDEKLPHLLFAYQEVPQESTGFSPFELMFGRKEIVFWVPSIEGTPEDLEEPVMYGDWDDEAGIEELRLPDHLPSQDKDQLLAALEDFETVFSNKPGGGQIAPLWDKNEAIKDWPPPQTKKQVRAFLGLAGHYRRFVPGFGATTAPLHELTKKGSLDPVVWKQGCQEAFDTLKAALVKQLILKVPLHDKPFYVATDASDVGLGAVLLQEHEETRHSVVYLSWKLIPWEQNLSSIEKECLAIVWALNKLKPYLWGQQFTVLSDHVPLQWLQTMQNTNAKLQ
ncbi:hypothetical protein Y1Q_0006949 [Alligator mississippiensis]|uniref:Integrase catalytic domain-containing protein n=1 Tax=Alligator mississippiensis TaxID=8496 RepID=A0A151PBU3_ALLMI|nr:hypothetical protein Y1Q_0006949 [Alligator mississippiensis]